MCPGTLQPVNLWQRGRAFDRRLLRWMWDDDAKVRWWVLLLVAAALGATTCLATASSGARFVAGLVVPTYCVVLAAVRLVKRR